MQDAVDRQTTDSLERKEAGMQSFRKAATSHEFQLAARLNLTPLGVLLVNPLGLGSKPGGVGDG
jgi:hypothetical protein